MSKLAGSKLVVSLKNTATYKLLFQATLEQEVSHYNLVQIKD